MRLAPPDVERGLQSTDHAVHGLLLADANDSRKGLILGCTVEGDGYAVSNRSRSLEVDLNGTHSRRYDKHWLSDHLRRPNHYFTSLMR